LTFLSGNINTSAFTIVLVYSAFFIGVKKTYSEIAI
jgi:hypothetical protein